MIRFDGFFDGLDIGLATRITRGLLAADEAGEGQAGQDADDDYDDDELYEGEAAEEGAADEFSITGGGFCFHGMLLMIV